MCRSGTAVPAVGGTSCYLAQMLGALVLFVGGAVGFYVAAIAMLSNFFFMISGSWLLLVWVSHEVSPKSADA
jgi:hypothetical protein